MIMVSKYSLEDSAMNSGNHGTIPENHGTIPGNHGTIPCDSQTLTPILGKSKLLGAGFLLFFLPLKT